MWRAVNLIALIFVVFAGICQTPIYTVHEHFDTEKGLPQSYVSGVLQDEYGYIWVATLDGLARYDGNDFIYFNIDSEESKKLSSSQVYDIYLDKQGQIWVYHFNHLVDRLDPRTLIVERAIQPVGQKSYDDFQLGFSWKNVREIQNDHRGNWFGGDTVSFKLYDSTNYRLARFFETSFTRTTPIVHGFTEDDRGRLWIMTDNGLQVSDSTWSNFISFDAPNELNYNPVEENFRPMQVLTGGRIVFTDDNRIFIFNERSNQFKEIPLPPGPTLENDFITVMLVDHQKRVVFKYKGHVFRLEHDDSITCLWKSPTGDQLQISAIFIDRSNNMWVGINTGGLYRIDLTTPLFQSVEYKSNFLADILTDQLNIPPENLPDNWKEEGWSYGMRYLYSKEGLLLTHESYGYGNARRIYRLQGNDLILLPLEDLYFHYIIGLAEDQSDIWALDIEGSAFKWNDLRQEPEEYLVKHIPNTGVERLSDMISDEDAQWVIATKNILYELKKGKIVNEYKVGVAGSSLIDLAQDPNDSATFWISTLGGGLIKWNKLTRMTEEIFTKSEGLPSNSIGSIVPDSLGNLWMGTFNGISKFNTSTKKFSNYATQDGIIESEFNRHHSFILPDGRIALGATKGYSVFDPLSFRGDEYSPDVFISEIQINDQVESFSSEGLIDRPLTELSKMNLDYSRNSLRFVIAAMQFNDPASNQYRYQLEGFNENWVLNGNTRVVRFDNLSPGSYTLKLNASNTEGIWSENVKTLKINISPPPWLSWWAYCLYLIVALTVVYLYWKAYKTRLYRQQEIEFNKREAARLQEIDAIKTRFFSNITHEFRTPLTLILSPLEKYLREKEHPPELQKLLQNNYEQGNHLLNLVNQLLDISKLESGKMQVHKSVGDLSDFVRRSFDQFRPYAADKGLQMGFEDGGIKGNFIFEKVHWEKIVMNLVGNAIKFTDKGQVRLTLLEKQLHMDKSTIQIKVQDSGIGIAPEQLEKLFDRFYQADDSESRDQEGTGIGLSLVKELTDLLGGKINVKSNLGKGSTFTVELEAERVHHIPDQVELVEVVDDEALFLVVEDNADLRKFLVETLSEGRNVLSAKNGFEAWKLIVDKLPDVIISDIMMPKMNGYELCEKVKSDMRTAHISFLLLTAKTAQESKERGLAFGADEYLTKPFHAHELELRIDNLIKQQSNLRNHLRTKLLSPQGSANLENVGDEFINQLYSFLEEHHAETDLDVSQIANFFAMSKSTLNRKLRSLLNISANSLVKQYRLQKAKELLKMGHAISQVCYAVGFESPSYFAQTFKEYYGKTPSEHLEQYS